MSAAKEREPHYTKIAEWVSECGANGMETAVYQHLAKRLNHSSGSRSVDPSRARLAADVGLKKPDDVDPYLRALAALGAIVVHAAKGKRTKYELPLWPPDGYDGPANTHAADKWQQQDPKGYTAWRAHRRSLVEAAEAPYATKRKARVAKSAARKTSAQAPEVPVATGRSADPEVPVATGRYQPVVTGTHLPVATGTNQDDTNDQTNRGGDGRQASTRSGGERGGGDAASGNTNPSPDERRELVRPADIRTVLAAIPRPLSACLEEQCPRGLPKEVTAAVEAGITQEMRTATQLAARLAARWVRFGYEDDALATGGKGLDRGVGVLLELLSPSKCWGNDARCEDGIDLDRGEPCVRCEEAREDRIRAAAADTENEAPAGVAHGRAETPPAARELGPAVPVQYQAAVTPEGQVARAAAVRTALLNRERVPR